MKFNLVEPSILIFFGKNNIFMFLCLFFSGLTCAQPFTNVTVEIGLIHTHSNTSQQSAESLLIAAGGAVADYDADGDIDIYLIAGSGSNNKLYRNNGDGTFSNISQGSGTDLNNIFGSGPLFFDADGDGDLDLLTLSINRWDQPLGSDPDALENRPRLLINQGNGIYVENTQNSGFNSGMPSYSVAAGDLDLDGDLDLFMTHWISSDASFEFFWENDGSGHFTDVTNVYLGSQITNLDRFSFTPNITDINNDGWPDVLLAADFGTSRIFLSNGVNAGQLTFTVTKPAVLTDENGMGASVADYDNDGDMDWFVTSIKDPDGIPAGNWGITGNRLYANQGDGSFVDMTDTAGVRDGFWGWGSCFADFNNDGHLDIYHENGFPLKISPEFHEDPARLFMSDGDGTFTEKAAMSGLNHTGQGRGVSCLDYDLDGDLDILIMPNGGAVQLFRNDLNNANHYLDIVLSDRGANPFAIGAKIQIQTTLGQQLREVTAGSNFASNNPMKQHFGLGTVDTIQSLSIQWADGNSRTILGPLSGDKTLNISRYCHTQQLTKVVLGSGNQAQLDLYANMPDGAPVVNTMISLEVISGPNTGQSVNILSDTNGKAQFNLLGKVVGHDRIRYQFLANGQTCQCLASIAWLPEMAFFSDGFE